MKPPLQTDSLAKHAADRQLALSAVQGVRHARAEFAQRMRCVPRILSAQNARLGRPLGADDLTDLAQETLLKLWTKLAGYEGRASLESWAYSFCVLELRNELRRARRRPRHLGTAGDEDEAQLVPEAPREPAAGLLDEEARGWLRHLSARESEIVTLRHFEGLEIREIAELLGLSLSSVKTHYYRALEKLRLAIQDPWQEDSAAQVSGETS